MLNTNDQDSVLRTNTTESCYEQTSFFADEWIIENTVLLPAYLYEFGNALFNLQKYLFLYIFYSYCKSQTIIWNVHQKRRHYFI